MHLTKETRDLLRYLLAKDLNAIMAKINNPESFTKDQFIDACCQCFNEFYPGLIKLATEEKYWIKAYYLKKDRIKSAEHIIPISRMINMVTNPGHISFTKR